MKSHSYAGWVSWLFICFPLVIQVPFTLLAVRFNYPDVLRRPPSEILQRFLSGGVPLIMTWYAYAMSVLIFAGALLVLHRCDRNRYSVSTWIGLFSAVVQLIGLLRWTFLVPVLARGFASSQETELREFWLGLFQIQHAFFGVGLGEHLGQLTLAAWTFVYLWETRDFPRLNFLRWLGYSSAGVLMLGTSEQLALMLDLPALGLDKIALVGFVGWSVWLLGEGLARLRVPSQEMRS